MRELLEDITRNKDVDPSDRIDAYNTISELAIAVAKTYVESPAMIIRRHGFNETVGIIQEQVSSFLF